MGTCRSCGGTVPAGAPYCPTCDAAQPPPEFVSLVRPQERPPEPRPEPEPKIQPWSPPAGEIRSSGEVSEKPTGGASGDDDLDARRSEVEAMFAAASTRRTTGSSRRRGMMIILLGFGVMSVIGVLGLVLMMNQVRNTVGGGGGGIGAGAGALAELSLQLTLQTALDTFGTTQSFAGASETQLDGRVPGVRFLPANEGSTGARIVSVSALPTTFVATAASGNERCIFVRVSGPAVEWAEAPDPPCFAHSPPQIGWTPEPPSVEAQRPVEPSPPFPR